MELTIEKAWKNRQNLNAVSKIVFRNATVLNDVRFQEMTQMLPGVLKH